MIRKNESLILLSVLIICAIIALTSPIKKTAELENQEQNKEALRQFPALIEKNEPQAKDISVSDYYRLFKEEKIKEPALEKETIEENPSIATSKIEKPTINSNQTNILSIESILAEIDEMAAKLKVKLEKSQDKSCSACGNSQNQTDDSGVPTCSAILAVGAGACNCGTLGCTPPVGPWCVHPCCCVCCPVCCR